MLAPDMIRVLGQDVSPGSDEPILRVGFLYVKKGVHDLHRTEDLANIMFGGGHIRLGTTWTLFRRFAPRLTYVSGQFQRRRVWDDFDGLFASIATCFLRPTLPPDVL